MIRFAGDVHTALWGTEDWLVSAHCSSPSKIIGADGGTLRDLHPDFPLLIKRIRAEKRLSVQVHPNDQTAKTIGGEAKTEMWCVLKAGVIFAGFKPGTTPSQVEQAVVDGTFEKLLVRYDAKPGECYFIPGGLVHAIGEGTAVYEVQQSSDTTFRLYDWGRLGADGQPRQLHVKEGLAAMNISLPPPIPSDSVDCQYFSFTKVAKGMLPQSDSLRVVYLPSKNETFLLERGEMTSLSEDAWITTVK